MVWGHWFQYAVTWLPAATVAESCPLPRDAPFLLQAREPSVGFVMGSYESHSRYMMGSVYMRLSYKRDSTIPG